MSIPFHSRITRQNWSKDMEAMPKGSKITLLGLDPKETKIEESETNFQKFLFKSVH